MCSEIETHILFILCGGTRVARFPPLLPRPARCHALACIADRRPHHLREPAVNKVFPQGMFLHEHPVTYRHAPIHREHTQNMAAKFLITLLMHINASKPLSRCINSLSERSTQGLLSWNSSATSIWVAKSTSSCLIASTRTPPSWFYDMHLILVLRVGNKEFMHILEGDHINTQPRLSICPDRHLDFLLLTAAGSAFTSRVAPTCRMESVRALRSRSSCCCREFLCYRLVSHTSTENRDFRHQIIKMVTLWAVSGTYPIQFNCTDSHERGPGGISSEDFPS